ncbi:hypothetical protein ACF0H5_001423 [Mactra antiquata]
MPPKSIAPSGKSSKKGKDLDKFPVSKVDYTQPLLVKNSKVSFGEKIGQVKEEHQDRLEDLIYEVEAVKRENDRLRRQQEDTYGISLDTVERMKKELERAKTTRAFLMEDIEVRKAQSERMEADIFELNMKIESFTKKINELNKMKADWQETQEKLAKSEEKCEKLSKINKNLRVLMSKHHIDPKAVDFDSGKSKPTGKNEKTTAKPILKHNNLKKKPDAHTQSHKNTYHGHKKSNSWADITENEPVIDDTLKHRSAITSRKALGRGPPSYLGYYTDIYQNKMMARSKYDSVHLPKLVVA